MLTRTRGGAVPNDISYDLPIRYKTTRQTAEKERIAAEAAAMVESAWVVGLNGGTTTTAVARALTLREDLGGLGGDVPAVTVVTNALNIAHELSVRQQIKVVLTGGVLRPQSFELIGSLGRLIPERIRLDIVFFGVNAIDPVDGAFVYHEDQASIVGLLLEHAERVVAVADSSKLGRHVFSQICEPDQIDVLITDVAAPPNLLRQFEDAGIDVRAV
ncbi:DeoR/GlpR family DNA-binding transcription regulator [Kribbella solani]|uniref:DeoR/GlpR family DNA-binding transcription regulator n=1 Tax=Kribbella solani TaxID=236067 RepID=UPI0029A05BE6|nr:DeoR/GlpR family DNA-binding transcription regulator [Kribbella solani]MDX3004816.1 DeoR/GlpR family DNA-binding transcription regulator [Kribbella solani]